MSLATLVDLTHTLDPATPSWNGSCGFRHEIKLDYPDCATEVKFRVQQITMHAGIGTHIDAPAHCIPGGMTVDELPLTQLIVPCVVIDVSREAHERYSLSIADVEAFERTYGVIKPGTLVLVRTGWERFWLEPERYRNQHLFPSVSGQAAEMLLERGVVGLGIDTLSPDRPEDGYPVHAAFLGAGKCIIENVAHSVSLPPVGSHILALPIKTKGGTEAPIRLVGFIHSQ